MQSKILVSVLVFIVLMVIVLMLGSLFSTCADDMTPSNGIINFSFTNYNDTLTVLDFEVLGTKADEKRQLLVDYPAGMHSDGIKMDYYENGSIKLEVYQDTLKISVLELSKTADTLITNQSGRPTKILVTPSEFTGKGTLTVRANQ